MSLWKAKNSRLGIWDSLALGLYVNSLHLSFNLEILGTCLRMVILIYHELQCSPTKAGSQIHTVEYAHRNKSPWSNPSRGHLRFLNSAIRNLPCSNNPQVLLSPHGSQRDNAMGHGNRDLEVQSWAAVGTVGADE